MGAGYLIFFFGTWANLVLARGTSSQHKAGLGQCRSVHLPGRPWLRWDALSLGGEARLRPM